MDPLGRYMISAEHDGQQSSINSFDLLKAALQTKKISIFDGTQSPTLQAICTHRHTHCKGHGNQLAFSPALN